MQLPKKQKNFCCFIIAYLKSRLNFEHFEKTKKPHRLSIFDIIDSEKSALLKRYYF